MSLNIELIKKLRAETSASIKDCNNALRESNNNIIEAVEWLRLKGVASARKKSSRSTREGIITIFNANNKIVLLELNAETDFVCKNEKFLKLADKIAEVAHSHNIGNIQDLVNYPVGNIKVNEYINEHIATIGENIVLKRVKLIQPDNGTLHYYIHGRIGNNSGSIITVINISGNNSPEIQEFAKHISMHITATKPMTLNVSDLDPGFIAKERQIITTRVQQEGKPTNITIKIVEGKLNKFYENVVLMEQISVIDNKTKIRNLSNDIQNKFGNTITSFARFEVGEDSYD